MKRNSEVAASKLWISAVEDHDVCLKTLATSWGAILSLAAVSSRPGTPPPSSPRQLMKGVKQEGETGRSVYLLIFLLTSPKCCQSTRAAPEAWLFCSVKPWLMSLCLVKRSIIAVLLQMTDRSIFRNTCWMLKKRFWQRVHISDGYNDQGALHEHIRSFSFLIVHFYI